MPSMTTSYCLTLVCVALYYIILHCHQSLTWAFMPSRHVPYPHHMQSWSLYGHMPYPHYMQFWSLHATITCSSWAYGTYAMPSSHAVLELVWHMPCHHYMQSWDKYWAYVMPLSNAISELMIYMHCHQLLLCIAFYCFVLLQATLYYFVFGCTLSLIGTMGLTSWGL